MINRTAPQQHWATQARHGLNGIFTKASSGQRRVGLLIRTGPYRGKRDLPVFALVVEPFRGPCFDQEVFCLGKLGLSSRDAGAKANVLKRIIVGAPTGAHHETATAQVVE